MTRPPLPTARRIGPIAAVRAELPAPFAGVDTAGWLDDLRLFATAWVGGVIFFGTLLG
jgi:hypothetical protein